MKNLCVYLFLMLLFLSCDKKDTEYLQLMTRSVLLNSRDTVFSVNVESNTEWNVRSTEDWCSIDKKLGKDDLTLTLQVTKNKSVDHRISLIIVNSGAIADTLNVLQFQNDSLVIDDNKKHVNYKGGSVYVYLKSNSEYNVIIPDTSRSWISETKARTLESKRITFVVNENRGDRDRNAVILVEYGKYNKIDTIKITQDYYIPVKSIELNQTFLTLNKDDKFQLKATCYPENATYNSVKWTSSNNDVVFIDEDGLITIKGDSGFETITAKAINDDVQSSCSITIKVPMRNMYFDYRDLEVVFGSEFIITPKFTPSNTTDNRNVYFYVDDTDIVSVKDLTWGRFVATQDISKNNHTTRIVGECEYLPYNDECTVKVVDAIAESRIGNFIFTDEQKIRFESSLTYSSYRNIVVMEAKIVDNYGNIRFTHNEYLPYSKPGKLEYSTDFIDVSDIFSHNLEEIFVTLCTWKFYIEYYFEDERVVRTKEVYIKRQSLN